VAVELISSASANRIGVETGASPAALLIRFAGNDKAVDYQIELALGFLKQSSVSSTNVVTEDSRLWQSLAALPIQASPSSATRVLPSDLWNTIRSFDGGALWQVGIADGRIRIMNHPPDRLSLDPLSQRVKQQLDPFNLFRGHDHEHAA
jgi:hypothetical protein